MHGHPVDLEKFTPILKNVYLPYRKKAFNYSSVLFAQLRKGSRDSVTYAGNDLFFDVVLGRRGGFVASARGFFPQGKMAPEKQGRVGITRTYARVAVDGLGLKVTSTERAAYISLAKKVVEDLQGQWGLEQGRIGYGDGRAIRAVVQAKNSNTEYVLHYPYGISNAGPGNLHLTVGEDIAIVDTADFTVHGKARITNISLSGDLATVTIDTAIAGSAASDYFVTAVPAAVDSSDTSFAAEPYGLEAIVDPSSQFVTFEGIQDPLWKAYATTSTTVNELKLMSFLNVIRARSGVDWKKNPEQMLLMTTTGIWQMYGESLLGMRRFNAPVMNLKGGFKGVQVGNATLVDDPWCPRGRLYAIHTPDLLFIDLMDFGMLKYQDSPKWRLAENQDIYTAVYGSYWNIGTLLRNTHGVITGLTDTVNYSPVYA